MTKQYIANNHTCRSECVLARTYIRTYHSCAAVCVCKRALERRRENGKRVALGNNCLTRFQPAPGASINRRVAAGTNYMPTFLVTPFAYICRVWRRREQARGVSLFRSRGSLNVFCTSAAARFCGFLSRAVERCQCYRYRLDNTLEIL